jgi:hypothetical protein
MIFGVPPLLFVHVVLSLIGIATGLVVLYGLVTGKPDRTLTVLFLASTVLTSLTGFPLAGDADSAVTHFWHPVVGAAGRRDRCPLRLSSRRRMALDFAGESL